jgi:hypothetical protein
VLPYFAAGLGANSFRCLTLRCPASYRVRLALRHCAQVVRQLALVQPEVDQRHETPNHPHRGAVQRVAGHLQAANVATLEAVDLGAAVAEGRASPWPLGGGLLRHGTGRRVRSYQGHAHVLRHQADSGCAVRGRAAGVTLAEVLVLGIVAILCLAINLNRDTLDLRVSAILTPVALLAAAAVALRRWFG